MLAQRNNFIDEHVFNKLAALRIEPSDLCDDAEFLRRAFLDTIGMLPTPDGSAGVPGRPAAGQTRRLIDALAGAAGVRRLLGAVPGRPVPEPQGARPRRARHQGRARLPRLAAQAGGRQSAVGRIGPRRADRPGHTTDNPAVGYFIVTVGETRGRAVRGRRLGGPGVSGHAHRLRPVPQPPAGTLHAGRLLPFRRLLLAHQAATARTQSRGRRVLRVAAARRQAGQEPGRRDQPRTGQFLKPAAARPLGHAASSPSDDPRVSPGGVDDRSEERSLQRRDGQPHLAAFPRRRPGRAGGRPARHQPAHQPRPVASPEPGIRRAPVTISAST